MHVKRMKIICSGFKAAVCYLCEVRSPDCPTPSHQNESQQSLDLCVNLLILILQTLLKFQNHVKLIGVSPAGVSV